MRLHTTQEFADARSEHEAACQAVDRLDLDEDNQRVHDAADEAFRRMLIGTPALTPSEIGEKLTWFLNGEVFRRQDGAEYHTAIMNDLQRLQGWAVSPAILSAWTALRNAQEATDEALETMAAQGALDARSKLYRELALAWCCTPGDFILKRYASLLSTIGSTFYGEAQEDGTGSPWDIDLDGEGMPDALFDRADVLGCYADIASTDVGANLLVYGLPHFDAGEWMPRAEVLGIAVHVIDRGEGGQSLSIGMIDPPAPPRTCRQRNLLRAILAFPSVENRTQLLAAEICQNWPHLVCRPASQEG